MNEALQIDGGIIHPLKQRLSSMRAKVRIDEGIVCELGEKGCDRAGKVWSMKAKVGIDAGIVCELGASLHGGEQTVLPGGESLRRTKGKVGDRAGSLHSA